jgi:hypothetical protein
MLLQKRDEKNNDVFITFNATSIKDKKEKVGSKDGSSIWN